MDIKHLLNGVAIVAALALAAPVWAQTAGGDTYGGNSMGLPGPNPGGPDVPSPYDAPGGAYYQVAPRPIPASTAATPAHHAVRHASTRYAHHKAMVQKVALTGDTTAQLNRGELARIQSGSPAAPPPYAPMSAALPPQPNPSGGNSLGVPGPNPGGPGLIPYTR
jgi:hypothetical protein